MSLLSLVSLCRLCGYIVPYHTAAYRVMLCHGISCRASSCRNMLYRIISCCSIYLYREQLRAYCSIGTHAFMLSEASCCCLCMHGSLMVTRCDVLGGRRDKCPCACVCLLCVWIWDTRCLLSLVERSWFVHPLINDIADLLVPCCCYKLAVAPFTLDHNMI